MFQSPIGCPTTAAMATLAVTGSATAMSRMRRTSVPARTCSTMDQGTLWSIAGCGRLLRPPCAGD